MACCVPQLTADEAVPGSTRVSATARITDRRLTFAMGSPSCAMCLARLRAGTSVPATQGGEPLFGPSEGLQGIERSLHDLQQRSEPGRLIPVLQELGAAMQGDLEPVPAGGPLILQLRTPPRRHGVARPGEPRDELLKRVRQGTPREPGARDDVGEPRLGRFDLV